MNKRSKQPKGNAPENGDRQKQVRSTGLHRLDDARVRSTENDRSSPKRLPPRKRWSALILVDRNLTTQQEKTKKRYARKRTHNPRGMANGPGFLVFAQMAQSGAHPPYWAVLYTDWSVPFERQHMSTNIVCVGYRCPYCGKMVAVLRSNEPVPRLAGVIESECSCGYVRPIRIGEVQSLDVWHEDASLLVPTDSPR